MCIAAEEHAKKCPTIDKVQVMSEWLLRHKGHGKIEKSLLKVQPPSYTLLRLTCPCGKSIIDMEEKAN